MAIVKDDVVSVAFSAIYHLCHPAGKHGIDVAHVAFKVNAVVKGGAFLERVFPVAISGYLHETLPTQMKRGWLSLVT